MIATQPRSTQPHVAGPAEHPLVALSQISKRFGEIVALDDVSIQLGAGEILGVLGENGAEKTTLLQILAGMLRPDAGRIAVAESTADLRGPQDAIRLGIGTVYQHFTLIPALSVIENLVLGLSGGVRLDLDREASRLQSMIQGLGLTMPLHVPVRTLSMGERQRVEIAKVLVRGPRIILLDEPTSVLTPGEAEALFSVLRTVSLTGIGIMLVTHKLGEAMSVCDRIVVMRSGRVAGEIGAEDLRRDPAGARRQVIEHMFGGAVAPTRPAALGLDGFPDRTAPPIMSLDQVSVRGDAGSLVVDAVSFVVRPGEIFGVAGVDGNGQRELAEAISGQRSLESGTIRLDGHDASSAGVPERRERGVGYVTGDRLGEGAVAGSSIADNLALKGISRAPFSRRGLTNRGLIRDHAAAMMAKFAIRAPGPETPVGRLSGGNVQRVLLARELDAAPRILVCKDPTQGLDVQTSVQMLDALRAHAAAGNGVVLISSELDDLLGCASRIGVMYRGRLAGIVARERANVASIGSMMLGGPPPGSAPDGCLAP